MSVCVTLTSFLKLTMDIGYSEYRQPWVPYQGLQKVERILRRDQIRHSLITKCTDTRVVVATSGGVNLSMTPEGHSEKWNR